MLNLDEQSALKTKLYAYKSSSVDEKRLLGQTEVTSGKVYFNKKTESLLNFLYKKRRIKKTCAMRNQGLDMSSRKNMKHASLLMNEKKS